MVRLTSWLRVPTIKFRKGGKPGGPPPITKKAGSCAMTCPMMGKPAAAPMSTGEAIPPDIDLPPQYMRAPLSEEEIDLINGGGIA